MASSAPTAGPEDSRSTFGSLATEKAPESTAKDPGDKKKTYAKEAPKTPDAAKILSDPICRHLRLRSNALNSKMKARTVYLEAEQYSAGCYRKYHAKKPLEAIVLFSEVNGVAILHYP
jgi:hypothetical protein